MVFNFSNSSGCAANSSTSYNSSPIGIENILRVAPINDIRDAIGGWYNSQGFTSWTWDNSSVSSTTPIEDRAVHLNELRHAINKIRDNISRVKCYGICSCGCNFTNSGTCACNNGCNSQTQWMPTAGVYAWADNVSGCNSNSYSGSDPKRLPVGPLLDGQITQLQNAIADINNDQYCQGLELQNYNQSF